MKALAPLTALTHLDLKASLVSAQRLSLLAPLAARLTCLFWSWMGDYGDPEMIAVSSLTALTRLEMLYFGDEDCISEDGLGALSFLTSLVHLELDLYELW